MHGLFKKRLPFSVYIQISLNPIFRYFTNNLQNNIIESNNYSFLQTILFHPNHSLRDLLAPHTLQMLMHLTDLQIESSGFLCHYTTALGKY